MPAAKIQCESLSALANAHSTAVAVIRDMLADVEQHGIEEAD